MTEESTVAVLQWPSSLFDLEFRTVLGNTSSNIMKNMGSQVDDDKN